MNMKIQLFFAITCLSLVFWCGLVPIHAQIISTRSIPYEPSTNGGGSPFITVDSFGNAYLADAFFNGINYDFITIKVDVIGNLVWSNCFDGPSRGDDVPTSIAVDANGNVFVIGSSSTDVPYQKTISTVEYDASGYQQWFATYVPEGLRFSTPVAIVLDNGNAYVTGYSQSTNYFEDYEYFTIKYTSSGNASWTNLVTGIGGENAPVGNGIDDMGNIYVAGDAEFDSSGACFLILKYHPDGHIIWTNRINNLSNGNNYASGMTVDRLGNTYVVGRRLVVKCDSNGNLSWSRAFPGIFAGAVAVDRLGNVVVCGQERFFDTDLLTVKYDRDGTILWTQHNYGGLDDSYLQNLAIDEAGNIYLVYYSTGTPEWGYRLENSSIVALSPDGAEKWADSIAWIGFAGLAVDSGGNVFVGLKDLDNLALLQYTQQYAPPLSIVPQGDHLLLSWAALATNVVLESIGSLSNTSIWQRITNQPVVVANRNVVTNALSLDAQFFRLRAQYNSW